MTTSPAKIAVKDRVAHGLCPQCGKEAAPYRLCWNCRTQGRVRRALKKAVRYGAVRTDGKRYWSGDKADDPAVRAQLRKWDTPFVLPESDGRGKPRVRGIRVDVEATLYKVIEFIGRPCTIEEIMAAWGRLRDKRTNPLPVDLGRIITAEDKRARKAARRRELATHPSP